MVAPANVKLPHALERAEALAKEIIKNYTATQAICIFTEALCDALGHYPRGMIRDRHLETITHRLKQMEKK
jgi:hypothetical protein